MDPNLVARLLVIELLVVVIFREEWVAVMAFVECNSVAFAAIGRVSDGCLVCTWNNEQHGAVGDDPRVHTVEKLVGAIHKKKMQPGQRQKLTWDNNDVFFTLDFPDGALLYLVIIPKERDYPPRLAYYFLTEMLNMVYAQQENGNLTLGILNAGRDGVSRELANGITELAIRFEDPAEVDKIERLKGKTDHVKDVMRENIHNMLSNLESLDDLTLNAQAMKKEADEYETKALDTKNYFWWRDCRVTFILILVVLALMGTASFCLCKGWCSSSKDGGAS